MGSTVFLENHHRIALVQSWIECISGIIFIMDYVLRLCAAKYPLLSIVKGPRVIDGICLLPTLLWFSGMLPETPLSWRYGDHGRFLTTSAQLGLVLRPARLSQLPALSRVVKSSYKTVLMAIDCWWKTAIMMVQVWFLVAGLFYFCEGVYGDFKEESRHELANLSSAIYYTYIFLLGEWAIVDLSV